MSGGRFGYDQFKIGYIADAIEDVIKANGKTRNQLHDEGVDEIGDIYRAVYVDWLSKEDALRGWDSPQEAFKYRDRHNEEKALNLSDETIREFKNAVNALRIAQIYAQRVDWLLSDDDGEKSFHSRLKEELEEASSKTLS